MASEMRLKASQGSRKRDHDGGAWRLRVSSARLRRAGMQAAGVHADGSDPATAADPGRTDSGSVDSGASDAADAGADAGPAEPGPNGSGPGQPLTTAPASGAATTMAAPVIERQPAPGRTGVGPVEWVMSSVIRKLAWSKLSEPKVAISVSAIGLLLGMLVGATAPNTETLGVQLPLSHLLPSLADQNVLASVMLYTGNILACLGLAGMLWAHSQGWRPNPRHLLLASACVVAVMVSLTPVGSSDTASYAAYGRIAALGHNPYTTSPLGSLGPSSPYTTAVGDLWKTQPSVYGPFATLIQKLAAIIGGPHVATTIWVLMILNGLVFIGVGVLLLKTSDDPIRATLFWVANPVILQ